MSAPALCFVIDERNVLGTRVDSVKQYSMCKRWLQGLGEMFMVTEQGGTGGVILEAGELLKFMSGKDRWVVVNEIGAGRVLLESRGVGKRTKAYVAEIVVKA